MPNAMMVTVLMKTISMLDRMNSGTTPQKAMIADLGAVMDTWEMGWQYKSWLPTGGLLTRLRWLPYVGADWKFLSQNPQ
ncbi:hypothetical protein N7449_004989 [Penicillium cf. viridicatum]|uniref:Uncharacterized protein n=1 Tax=Penicillium cf. viridicatum TaxID=2972119 RepID=A0A9W9SYW5_9EURO|nr:hypothetical protein N7449_004989 [Penicillium cf. viridicatum]